jgi:hypothetical protein
VRRAPRDAAALAEAIEASRPHVVWLTNVWTPELLELLGTVSCRLRSRPGAPWVFFDTHTRGSRVRRWTDRSRLRRARGGGPRSCPHVFQLRYGSAANARADGRRNLAGG